MKNSSFVLKNHKAKLFKMASTSPRCPHSPLRCWICNKNFTTLSGILKKSFLKLRISFPHSSQLNIGFVRKVHFCRLVNHYLLTTVISSPVSPRKFITIYSHWNRLYLSQFAYLLFCLSYDIRRYLVKLQ